MCEEVLLLQKIYEELVKLNQNGSAAFSSSSAAPSSLASSLMSPTMRSTVTAEDASTTKKKKRKEPTAVTSATATQQAVDDVERRKAKIAKRDAVHADFLARMEQKQKRRHATKAMVNEQAGQRLRHVRLDQLLSQLASFGDLSSVRKDLSSVRKRNSHYADRQPWIKCLREIRELLTKLLSDCRPLPFPDALHRFLRYKQVPSTPLVERIISKLVQFPECDVNWIEPILSRESVDTSSLSPSGRFVAAGDSVAGERSATRGARMRRSATTVEVVRCSVRPISVLELAWELTLFYDTPFQDTFGTLAERVDLDPTTARSWLDRCLFLAPEKMSSDHRLLLHERALEMQAAYTVWSVLMEPIPQRRQQLVDALSTVPDFPLALNSMITDDYLGWSTTRCSVPPFPDLSSRILPEPKAAVTTTSEVEEETIIGHLRPDDSDLLPWEDAISHSSPSSPDTPAAADAAESNEQHAE